MNNLLDECVKIESSHFEGCDYYPEKVLRLVETRIDAMSNMELIKLISAALSNIKQQ